MRICTWVGVQFTFTHHHKLCFTDVSDLVCSLVIIMQNSRWERVLVRFRSFALEISSSLARTLHIITYCFMIRPAVADFPEGAIQFCARTSAHAALCRAQQLVNSLEAVTIPSRVNSSSSCRRSWSLHALPRPRGQQHVTFFNFMRHLL